MSTGEKKIQLVNGKYDIKIDTDGDFVQDEGLETAILMSLLLNERANASEVPQPTKRGGYWGYEVNGMQFSKIWLVSGRKTSDKLNKIIEYANSCLQWLVSEGYATGINCSAEFISEGIELTVSITKENKVIYSENTILWLNTDF